MCPPDERRLVVQSLRIGAHGLISCTICVMDKRPLPDMDEIKRGLVDMAAWISEHGGDMADFEPVR